MELSELIAAIGAYATDAATQKELARALRADATTKPIAQLLLNAGAGRKTGETQAKVTELETKITALEEERDGLTEQLETAKSAPNEQQAAWDREKKKLADKLAATEAERDTERTHRKGDAVKLSRSAFLTALKGRVDDFGLKAVDNEFSARFRPRDDGAVDVLDEDGEPIEAPKGKTAEEILAEKAFETVPASNRLRQMNAGGGSSGGGHDSGPIREKLDEEKASSGAYRM